MVFCLGFCIHYFFPFRGCSLCCFVCDILPYRWRSRCNHFGRDWCWGVILLSIGCWHIISFGESSCWWNWPCCELQSENTTILDHAPCPCYINNLWFKELYRFSSRVGSGIIPPRQGLGTRNGNGQRTHVFIGCNNVFTSTSIFFFLYTMVIGSMVYTFSSTFALVNWITFWLIRLYTQLFNSPHWSNSASQTQQ